MRGRSGTIAKNNNIAYTMKQRNKCWIVIANGKEFRPIIFRGTGENFEWFYVKGGPQGRQWPGRYIDRHYAARDILRKAGLWKDEENYQDNF